MLSKKLLFVFFIAITFLSACKKEDDIANNNNNNTNNNNNNNNNVSACSVDTTRTWSLPWPEWVFYHWVWEDESTQQSAQQLVDDYRAHDIPVGAIIIDSPWETGYNTFDWDSSLYPNPQGMVDYFHSKDVRVFIWITSAINIDAQPLYNEGASNNYFMTSSLNTSQPAVEEWWKGEGSLIDFWNPAALAWWKGLMDKTLDLGIDGWKTDGTDLMALTGNYSPGKGSTVTIDEYSDAYYRTFHDYTRQRLGNDRVNTSRPIDNYGNDIGGNDGFLGTLATFAPVDINWAGWVGDQDADFAGMTWALNNMYHSSEFGYLAFGSDVGGYRENSSFPPHMRQKELFIRWAQLGAFSPIFENGGGGEHRPWMFDQQTEDIYRKLVKLRHGCMIPYLMESAATAYSNSESMMQFFNKTDYSYLLGPDIFVAPFLAEGTSIAVSFPAGSRWVYLYDETKVYDGGTTVTLDVPYEEYPAFFKEGSSLVDAIDFSRIE